LRVDPAGYAAALACGRVASDAIETLFADVDVLITPAAPSAAPRDLSTTGDPLFNRPWQLLDCPCVTLPGAIDASGMPLGLQVVGRRHDDGKALAAAAWISQVLRSDEVAQGRCLA